MISDGEGVDIKTFEERKEKPFAVSGSLDGFTIMMPRLISHVLDGIYNILKFSVSTSSPSLRRMLSNSSSIDLDYFEKVRDANQEKEKDHASNEVAVAMRGGISRPAE